MKTTGIIKYDAMCRAISEAHDICVVKEMRDQAISIEQYAAQAKNMEAERKACEIRLRAERRCGEMLKEMAKNGDRVGQGGNRKSKSHDATLKETTLADIGISRDQSSRWQKLAGVKEAEFEDALADPVDKPTTSGIIRKSNGESTKMNPSALWLWGRLRDFERDRIADIPPSVLLSEMTPTMVADVLRIAPIISGYLSSFEDIDQ